MASSDEESLCDSSSELELESSELLESESCFLFAFFFSAFFPVPRIKKRFNLTLCIGKRMEVCFGLRRVSTNVCDKNHV